MSSDYDNEIFDWTNETPHVGPLIPTSIDDQIEMILTYVPEAEYMDLSEAWLLARERDWEAAQAVLFSLDEQ